MASKLKKMFSDIGLEWGINKCAAIHMKQGKLVTNDNSSKMPVSKDCSIPVIGNEDHYKFLGKYQNTRHLEDKVIEEASKEYENRLWAVWTSPLSIPRKVPATNVYAVPFSQYYMYHHPRRPSGFYPGRSDIFGRKFTSRAEEPLGTYSRSGRIPSR